MWKVRAPEKKKEHPLFDSPLLRVDVTTKQSSALLVTASRSQQRRQLFTYVRTLCALNRKQPRFVCQNNSDLCQNRPGLFVKAAQICVSKQLRFVCLNRPGLCVKTVQNIVSKQSRFVCQNRPGSCVKTVQNIVSKQSRFVCQNRPGLCVKKQARIVCRNSPDFCVKAARRLSVETA